MEIQISLQDLLVFLLLLLGLAIGGYLLTILIQVRKVVKGLTDDLPDLLGNIKKISGDVTEVTGKLKLSLPNVVEDVQGVTHSVRKGTNSVGNAVESISSSVSETAVAVSGNINHYIVLLRVLGEAVKIFNSRKSSKK